MSQVVKNPKFTLDEIVADWEQFLAYFYKDHPDTKTRAIIPARVIRAAGGNACSVFIVRAFSDGIIVIDVQPPPGILAVATTSSWGDAP